MFQQGWIGGLFGGFVCVCKPGMSLGSLFVVFVLLLS